MNLYQDTDKFSVEKYGSHEEWLKKRGRGIGGSDAACFMDLNPWKTLNQLWHDKKFGSQQITNDAIEYGNTAEPCLRTLFQAKHPASPSSKRGRMFHWWRKSLAETL